MAIAFELVVNFGSNEAAADAAYEFVVGQAALLTVGDTSVGLHEPLLNLTRGGDGVPYLLMSVLPIGVGWGVAMDRRQEHLRLTAVPSEWRWGRASINIPAPPLATATGTNGENFLYVFSRA
jgi:hypothetical protein